MRHDLSLNVTVERIVFKKRIRNGCSLQLKILSLSGTVQHYSAKSQNADVMRWPQCSLSLCPGTQLNCIFNVP